MFLFVKTVNNCKYYYNNFTDTYEGLKDNGIAFTKNEIDHLLEQASKLMNKNDFSFININNEYKCNL